MRNLARHGAGIGETVKNELAWGGYSGLKGREARGQRRGWLTEPVVVFQIEWAKEMTIRR